MSRILELNQLDSREEKIEKLRARLVEIHKSIDEALISIASMRQEREDIEQELLNQY